MPKYTLKNLMAYKSYKYYLNALNVLSSPEKVLMRILFLEKMSYTSPDITVTRCSKYRDCKKNLYDGNFVIRVKKYANHSTIYVIG